MHVLRIVTLRYFVPASGWPGASACPCAMVAGLTRDGCHMELVTNSVTATAHAQEASAEGTVRGGDK